MSNNRRTRFRHWLHDNTHYRNSGEFFTGLLFECGPPPHPVNPRHMYRTMIESPEFHAWRSRVTGSLIDKLPPTMAPAHVVQEYLKWLIRQQENSHISHVGK